MVNKKIIIFSLSALIIFLFAGSASAFTISPSRITVTADALTEQKIFITVKNNEGQKLNFKASALGAVQDDFGRASFGKDLDVAEYWLKASPAEFGLKPGESKKVEFTVKVPQDATGGLAHYLGLAINARPENDGGNISSRLIAILTLQVAGMVSEKLEIQSLEIKAFKVISELYNSGSVAVPVSGEIQIKNLKGEMLYKEPVQINGMLLPKSARTIESDVNFKPKTPGIYKAVLSLKYGKTNQVNVFEIRWWHVPWYAVVIPLLIIFAIAVVFFRVLKKRRIKQ